VESNWRQNVADIGLVGEPFVELAARMVETIPGFTLYITRRPGNPQLVIYRVAPGQVPTAFAAEFRFGNGFPFDIPVYPD